MLGVGIDVLVIEEVFESAHGLARLLDAKVDIEVVPKVRWMCLDIAQLVGVFQIKDRPNVRIDMI